MHHMSLKYIFYGNHYVYNNEFVPRTEQKVLLLFGFSLIPRESRNGNNPSTEFEEFDPTKYFTYDFDLDRSTNLYPERSMR